ncbi:MAG: ATP-binding protein [Anaerolineae bacterium]|nr:ATP-binding protein [Anaerolineae bacterium]
MTISLRWKLALGFVLTVVIAVGLTGILARATTAQRFDLLISEAGSAHAQAIAPLLAAEYLYWGDWQAVSEQRLARPQAEATGVQFFLFPNAYLSGTERLMQNVMQNMMQDMMGRGRGMGRGGISFNWAQNAPANDWSRLALEAAGLQGAGGEATSNVQSGWSLNDLAAAEGEDLDSIVQAIIGAEEEAIERAVRTGEVEAEAAVIYLESLPEQIRAFLNTMRVQRVGANVEVVSPPQLTVEGSNWLLEGLLFGGERLLVADAGGAVVIDTDGELIGETLDAGALDAGAPVEIAGNRVGTVLVGAELGLYDAQQRAFLDGVSMSLLLSAGVAGAAALVLGVVIAGQITRPVHDLTTAAEEIAGGDLSQRVPVRSRDELGQMTAAFNRMAEEISTQRMLRSRLVDDIAHELNTPLSLIGLEIQAMADGMQTPEEAAVQLRREVAELQALTSDLAYLADAEAGAPGFERTPVPMNELVREISDRFASQAAASAVALEVHLCDDAPILAVDEARIGRALSNLLSNALRHTPEGGRIVVQTARQDGEWQVTVRDTGEGIPEGDLPHIWERFYRADRSRNRATGGRGLGLAIVRQAVELHGGRVWAESAVGAGAPSASPCRPQPAGVNPSGRGCTPHRPAAPNPSCSWPPRCT